MRFLKVVVILVCIFGLGACATPAKKIKNIRLGMTPDDVKKHMGEPYTVRAAKVFSDGQTTEVWEYLSGFSLTPKDYWIFFENGKVVQWGEPGDFAGQTSMNASVAPYKPNRDER